MTPLDYYISHQQSYQKEVDKLKRTSILLSVSRLTVFLIAASIIYLYWGKIALISLVLLGTIISFLILVSVHENIRLRIRFHSKMVSIQKDEIRMLDGDFQHSHDGSKYISSEHFYNQDLDLFGPGSLFQIVNRTETIGGEKCLANSFNQNDTKDILQKQKAIIELSKMTEWRHSFKATASIIELGTQPSEINNLVNNYKPFVPSIYKWLPFVFGGCSIGALAIYSLDIIPASYLLYWLLLGIALSGPFVKRITRFYDVISQMKDSFQQNGKLLEYIESTEFETELLKNIKQRIQTEGDNASIILRRLSKNLDYLGNRNNMIFAPLANGFLLWDLFFSYKIESWLKTHNKSIQNWFEAIDQIEALSSLGNYYFNHPTYIFPVISEDPKMVLESQQLHHPLIQIDKSISNDISIKKGEFFIITGANMAGKSTFLRTVGLTIIMANCGLPVPAKNYTYRPLKLISSMRTSDSLQEAESYFYSELKRLKFIIENISSDEYFIILDEILKGTNSKDKAEGSKSFVEKLAKSKTTGLIATHDLSLCVLEDSIPSIKNYYFDAQIVEDELYFDYTFKKGVCHNMNASFLLKKMGIV